LYGSPQDSSMDRRSIIEITNLSHLSIQSQRIKFITYEATNQNLLLIKNDL